MEPLRFCSRANDALAPLRDSYGRRYPGGALHPYSRRSSPLPCWSAAKVPEPDSLNGENN